MEKCLTENDVVRKDDSMYKDKKILAVIPARGGSKGVPRKNIKMLAGKPLIAWTIEAAKKSKLIDKCIVSTEDEEIRSVAEAWGGEVPFLRPAELAQDDTPGIAPVLHAIKMMPGYDFVVLLQVTSPLRIVEDIDGAIIYCLDNGCESCVGVTEAEHSPYWMYRMDERNTLQPILEIAKEDSYQRQKLPKIYQLNGAVYVSSIFFLTKQRGFVGEKTMGYVMPRDRSYDIDTMLDFEVTEFLLKKRLDEVY